MSTPDPLDPARAEELAALEPTAAERAIAELSSHGADAVPLLQRLDQIATKPIRKLARRGLHRLRSWGVEAVSVPPAGGRSVLQPVAGEAEEAWITPLDFLGRRTVLLMVPVKGGVRLHEVALSDVDGLLALQSFSGRRRDARRFIHDLRERGRGRLLAVPSGEARALIVRARALGGTDRPGIDRQAVAELAAGAAERTPGQRVRAALLGSGKPLDPGEADAVLARRAETGVLPPWPVLGEEVEALTQRLAEVERSPLVLSEIQQRERRSEIYARDAPAVLPPEVRANLAERLEDAAVFLLEAGDEAGAGAALEVAVQVRETGNPLDVGFLRRSLDVSLDLARRRRSEEDAGKLIVPG